MCICVKQTWNFETLPVSYWVALVILLDKLLEPIIITHLYSIDLVDTQLFEIVRANVFSISSQKYGPHFCTFPSFLTIFNACEVENYLHCQVVTGDNPV